MTFSIHIIACAEAACDLWDISWSCKQLKLNEKIKSDPINEKFSFALLHADKSHRFDTFP